MRQITMGRPPNPIDQFRDYVSGLYLDGVARSKIKYKLRRQFHVAVDLSTITRRIAKWGLARQPSRTCDLIFRFGLTEKQTLQVLQRQGRTITARGQTS